MPSTGGLPFTNLFVSLLREVIQHFSRFERRKHKASGALVLCGGGGIGGEQHWEGNMRRQGQGARRKQIIDSWEGKKTRGFGGKLRGCACFIPFTTNHITLKLFPKR